MGLYSTRIDNDGSTIEIIVEPIHHFLAALPSYIASNLNRAVYFIILRASISRRSTETASIILDAGSSISPPASLRMLPLSVV